MCSYFMLVFGMSNLLGDVCVGVLENWLWHPKCCWQVYAGLQVFVVAYVKVLKCCFNYNNNNHNNNEVPTAGAPHAVIKLQSLGLSISCLQ